MTSAAWIIGMLGVLAVFVLLASMYSTNSLFSPAGAPRTGSVSPTDAGPITDVLSLIDPTETTDLVGRTVLVQRVPIVEIINNRLIWVGPAGNLRLLVAHSGGESFKADQEIRINGTILLTPPPSEAAQMWELSDEDTLDLSGEDIYINASDIEVISQ